MADARAGGTASILANDFAAQWEEVKVDALTAVDRVGRSGWLVLGEEVRAFEEELARWWAVPHAVGVASGLDAIEIGLRCAGIGEGARVLTTPLTAFATTLAIIRAGAEPVWVDVDETGGLDLDAADAALAADPTIKALVPVHLYGHPLDWVKLEELLRRHEVELLEDCAQSAGASRDGRPTGATGRVAATSLYPTKNLGAFGDGGVLLTVDGELAERARRMRNYGQGERYHHVELGLNSRLDELQAAVLRSAQLPRLDAWLVRRAEIAARITAGLEGSSLRVIGPGGGQSANHLLPVEVTEGDPTAFAAHLKRAGVSPGRHYPVLCPEQEAVAGIGRVIGDLRVARRIAAQEISLPIHPHLSEGDVERILEACLSFVG